MLTMQHEPRTATCDICGRTTREGKPLCSEHILEMPYAQSILQYLQAREREIEALEKRGRVADGVLAQELNFQLRMFGEQTTARLARSLNMTEPPIILLVEHLAKKGKVCLGRTGRGSISVRLP